MATNIPEAFLSLFAEENDGEGLLTEDEITIVILATIAGCGGEASEAQIYAACQWANEAAITAALLHLVLGKTLLIDMNGPEPAFRVNDTLDWEDIERKLSEP